ncbi:MAG TPA: hypothetical protein VFM80_01490 [Gracilimonas sp.]|uniref:hypothetical protein n=1 Tax=Gracilimonas sp. TaxID=1974203 RepID=UPI002DA0AD6C|nr:hypothetical protein [Gracilimonas sp.]
MESSALRILNNAIFEAQTWKPSRSRNTLENDFYQLMFRGPSLDKHTELWNDFRKALAENHHLEDETLREFLTRPEYAREGYWWFDPNEWR